MRQEIAGHNIFIGPAFNSVAFCVCGCVGFLGHGAGLSAIKIAPSAHDLHGLSETCEECSPVGAARVKVGDVGRKGVHSGHVLGQSIAAITGWFRPMQGP